MRGMGRRDFLRAALLGAAGLALPRPVAAGGRRVIVVGAGLAGLYTATLLEQFGLEVIVLEARDRVGGRLYTLDHIPGNPEAGGNSIGPNYGRVIDMAGRLGVALQLPARPAASDYVIGGKRIAAVDWENSEFNPLQDRLRGLSPARLGNALLRDNPLRGSDDWCSPDLVKHDRSAAEVYRELGLNDAGLALIDANNSYGNTLAETSMLSLYRAAANINRAIATNKPMLEARGGNMRIPEAMAKALRGQVHLGRRVAAVTRRRAETEVTTTDGERLQADAAVLALPLPALGNIRFEPGLPEIQAEGFAAVRYNKVTQAHLLVEEPFWGDGAGSQWTDGPLGRIFSMPVGDGRYNTIVWINGRGCERFDRMGEEEAGEAIMAEYLALNPAAKGVAELRHLVRWHLDPFSGGSWPAWSPGQIGRYFRALQQPRPGLHFAGEHTGFSNSGMEAAMESGERAALEVMRALA